MGLFEDLKSSGLIVVGTESAPHKNKQKSNTSLFESLKNKGLIITDQPSQEEYQSGIEQGVKANIQSMMQPQPTYPEYVRPNVEQQLQLGAMQPKRGTLVQSPESLAQQMELGRQQVADLKLKQDIEKAKGLRGLIPSAIGGVFGEEAGETAQAVESALFNPLGLQSLAEKGLTKIDPGFEAQYLARKQLEREHPIASTVGRLAGDVVAGAPVFKSIGAGIGKVAPFIAESGTIAGRGTMGALEAGGFGLGEGAIAGIEEGRGVRGTAEEALKRAREYGTFGAGLGLATGTVGKGLSRLNRGVEEGVEDIFGSIRPSIEGRGTTAQLPRTLPSQLPKGEFKYKAPTKPFKTKEIKPSKYKVKNVPLQRAEENLNDAIETLQNKYQTRDIQGAISDIVNDYAPHTRRKIAVDSEYMFDYIKKNDNIDLKKLLKEIDVAEGKRIIPTAEQARLKRVAGIAPEKAYARTQKIGEYATAPKTLREKLGIKEVPTEVKPGSKIEPTQTQQETVESILKARKQPKGKTTIEAKETTLKEQPVKVEPKGYSDEVKNKLDELEKSHNERISNIRNDKVMSPELKQKQIKSQGMKYSAQKREIIQGDSLIPVEGGLTPKELANKIKYEKSNYAGKEVNTPDGEAIATGKTSYGNVQVKLKDGRIKSYPTNEVTPKVDIDAKIAQQKAQQQTKVAMPKETVPKATTSEIKPDEMPSGIKTQERQTSAFKEQPRSKVIESEITTEPRTTDAKIESPNNVSNEKVGRSKVITNTVRNKIPELQSEEGKAFTKALDDMYEIKTNKESIARAQKILDDDYEGFYNKIVNQGVDSSEETVAGIQMVRDLTSSGNYDEAVAVINGLKKVGTEHGQIIQAFSTAGKDSLEGIALRGQKLVEKINADFKKLAPKLYDSAIESISKEAKAISEAIKNNYKLLDIDLQKFAENVTKEVKSAIGKLYNKNYLDSIIEMAKKGEYTESAMLKAVKERYGLMTFDGEDLKKITELYNKAKTFDANTWDYRRYIYEAENVVKDKLPRNMTDRLATYQFIDLFGNTITPQKILGGNIANTVMVHFKDILKAMIDNSISRIRGKSPTAQYPSVRTKMEGIKRRWKEVGKDRKYEVNTNIFDLSYDFDKKHGLTFKNKFWRKAELWTSYFMNVMEQPFKQGIYDDELRMLMKKANLANPTEEMLFEAMENAKNIAAEKAQKYTFARHTPTTKLVTGAIGGINKMSNNMINTLTKRLPGKFQIKDPERFGLGKLVQPIIKTPINMVSMGFEYSPLGLFKIAFKPSQEEIADQLAKTLIGSVFGLGAGYFGKKAGIVTGGIPTDTEARQFSEESGRQPYALNIAGKSVDINYIQPLGMLVSAGAELDSEGEKAPFTAALDSMVNQGMLQGLGKLMGQTGVSRGKGTTENIIEAVAGSATTMVPLGSLLNQIGKSVDLYKRETGSDSITRKTLSSIMQRTPARLLLPKKVTTTGEFQKEDSILNTVLFPGKIKDIRKDSVTKELLRLYDESQETKQFPTKAKDEIKYKLSPQGETKTLDLNAKQLQLYRKDLGRRMRREIENTIRTSEYRTANDKQKATMISQAMFKAKQEEETKQLRKKGIREYK